MVDDQNQLKGVEAKLLHALAEDLKQPLLRIAYKTELAMATGNTEALPEIAANTKAAMQLIDTLLLGMRSLSGQLTLDLEPMVPAALLQNVQSLLAPQAALANCQIDIEFSGKQHLAMINPAALTASLTNLGQVLMDHQTGQTKNLNLKFVAYQSIDNPTIGVFATGVDQNLTARLLRQAKTLRQKSRGSIDALMVNNSGVFVAEQLLQAQSAKLIQSTRQGLYGLSIKLLPSHQLTMV